MALPASLGASDGALGVALAVGWLAVLGIGLYRYKQGTRSPDRFYMTVSAGGFWLAFSLLQISTALTGIAKEGVTILAVALFCAGIVTGVRWWRIRNTETVRNAPSSVLGWRWLRQTKAFALRNLRATLRTKATIIWGFGFPAFWYFVTSLLFLPDAESIGSEALLADIKGSTATSLGLFGVLTVTLVAFAGGLSADLTEKRYRKLRSLPVAPSADFAGRYLAGVIVAAISYVVVLIVGLLDGANYALRGPGSVPIIIVSFLLFSLIGVSVAVLVTRVVEDSELVVGITNAILLVSFFLTGYNGMTPGLLPEDSRWLVNVAPNSLASRLQAWHLTDTPKTLPTGAEGTGITPPSLPVGPEFVTLLATWAVVLGVAAAYLMNRGIYSGEGGE
jgi:ABC-2 type transport system permease protein